MHRVCNVLLGLIYIESCLLQGSFIELLDNFIGDVELALSLLEHIKWFVHTCLVAEMGQRLIRS
jgi:hypothetical protein